MGNGCCKDRCTAWAKDVRPRGFLPGHFGQWHACDDHLAKAVVDILVYDAMDGRKMLAASRVHTRKNAPLSPGMFRFAAKRFTRPERWPGEEMASGAGKLQDQIARATVKPMLIGTEPEQNEACDGLFAVREPRLFAREGKANARVAACVLCARRKRVRLVRRENDKTWFAWWCKPCRERQGVENE